MALWVKLNSVWMYVTGLILWVILMAARYVADFLASFFIYRPLPLPVFEAGPWIFLVVSFILMVAGLIHREKASLTLLAVVALAAANLSAGALLAWTFGWP